MFIFLYNIQRSKNKKYKRPIPNCVCAKKCNILEGVDFTIENGFYGQMSTNGRYLNNYNLSLLSEVSTHKDKFDRYI